MFILSRGLKSKNNLENSTFHHLLLHFVHSYMSYPFMLSIFMDDKFVWWCFNATFNNISAISGGQFYWWREPEEPKKTTGLSHVTDKLHNIILYTSPWSRFELTTSVVIGTDSICNCKSNYHTITAPWGT
jgi:hypothetical protein